MTYTYTYTRTSTLVDQVDIFLRSSGIEDAPRKRVVDAITEKWIEAVGVYVMKDGQRVLEGSLEISWKLHSDHADLTISTDLPGWENGAAPELAILAKRLRERANNDKLTVNFWVLFVKSIRDDPVLYKSRCEKVGVGGSPPPWKSSPRSQRIPIQDFPEAHVALLEAS
jgi:hypothetical protein